MNKADLGKPRNYRDLIVWQKGILLARQIHQLTGTYPNDERFGLMAQMHRAAVSIPSNLAEGQARHTTGEFIQFLSHAEGSLAELDTQVLLSIELGFAAPGGVKAPLELIGELRKMLNALRRNLNWGFVALVTHHSSRSFTRISAPPWDPRAPPGAPGASKRAGPPPPAPPPPRRK
jgi:four helix bundle protein